MRWSGQSYLYSWGDDQHGQLGLGEFLNDTMPNRIFSIQRPVRTQVARRGVGRGMGTEALSWGHR
jgi:hypothetical protein